MGGKTKVNAQTDSSIGGLRVQSSVMGAVRPLLWGRSRVSGNLIAYYDFLAIPHTSTTSAGGKGGSAGGGQSQTSFSYQAAIMFGVSDSLIAACVRAWKDKLVFGATTVNASNLIATDLFTAGTFGTYTVGDASVYLADVSVRYVGTSNITEGDHNVYPPFYVLQNGSDYTHDGLGNYAFLPRFTNVPLEVNYLVSSATATPSALPALGLGLMPGYDRQAPWGYLTTRHPDQALGYSGLAYLYAPTYDLGTNGEVGNHNFELSTFSEFSPAIVDAECARVVREFLTDQRVGALWPQENLGDLTAYQQATIAQGLFISPVLDTQQSAADWLTYLLKLTNADCVWTEGQLRIVPLLDQPATANGVTFTPNTVPVYDIGEEHYIATGDDPPLQPHLKAADDCYNHVRVEIFNRQNNYNTDIAEWKDDADIIDRGLRTMDVIEAHAICEMPIGLYVATLIGQRQLTIRREFDLVLPWTFALLDPLDLITITEAQLGLFRLPVRINSIEENDDYSFSLTVEECPIGLASAPRYGHQQSIGYAHDYNAKPGPVVTPFFFEPPIELTSTGLEVWAAVTGASSDWGGANVWASLDGLTYEQVGRIVGGSRYGVLAAGFDASSSAAVDVLLAGRGGQIAAASPADAEADRSLLFAGDASGGEFMDYTTSNLTGDHRYVMGGLLRGRYGTTPIGHYSGSVVRVDQAIAKSEPLDPALIGSTIFFKFVSFNVYGGGDEDLADVAVYPYTITGAMLRLPPSDVIDFREVFEGYGIRLAWEPIPDQDVLDYELRHGGTSWETAALIARVGGTSYLWEVQQANVGETIWIKAHDRYGNESRHATTLTLVVPVPQPTNLSATISGPNVRLDWSAVTGAFAIDHYLVTIGSSADPATQTVIAAPLTTRFEQRVNFGGTEFFGVAAVDVAGNIGPFVYVPVTIVSPGMPLPGTANHPAQEVIDNNVLLYWTPPTTGTLPVDRYLVRRGPIFDSAKIIGSNGNSTFAAIFEQVSGSYDYWTAAVDTAGNQGPALKISAVVNQPPDFVLHSSIDSSFAGSAAGLYGEAGHLWGPSFGETWDGHFAPRGWTDIQDQISAGFPLYFEPSANSAWYEEVFDYGAVLPSCSIIATLTYAVLNGAVTVTPLISYKLHAADSWIDGPAGAPQIVGQNFRFVKVRYDIAASGGDDLMEISGLNVTLSVKVRNDSGGGFANAGDVGGTPVLFNLNFVDCDTPQIQPNGTTAMIGICNFLDAPNPTGFTVFIFDLSGNRVSAPFSWTVRGY